MNGRLLGYGLAGLVLYLLFLIVNLPAHWLGEALNRNTNGALSLRNTQGTAWRGSGILELRGGSGQTLSTRARWDMLWLPLFTGKLGATLETRGDLNLQTELQLGLNSLTLRNAELELPAAQLPVLYAPAVFVSPTGTLHGKTQEFSIRAGQVSGEAQIRWLGAGSKVGAFGDLGDYLFVIHGENDSAKLRIETLRGDLKIGATGNWQTARDGQLTLQGSLNPGARDTALRPLTTLLQARREGDQYLLSTSARLALPTWLAAKK
jgi:hypothetical protein